MFYLVMYINLSKKVIVCTILKLLVEKNVLD